MPESFLPDNFLYICICIHVTQYPEQKLNNYTVNPFFDNSRKWLSSTAIVQYFRKLRDSRSLPRYTVSKIKPNEQSFQSVIFLCPALDEPSGGIKVIYHQANLINASGLISASVLHPLSPKYRSKWYSHPIPRKVTLDFDVKSDFVLIPEFWAVPHAELLQRLGIRYGIYVQGGYVMALRGSNHGKKHDDAYRDASLILAISDDTFECIVLAYPEHREKIMRVHCSVDSRKFVAESNKENIISYMPRRMQRHSKIVIFYLEKLLPLNWKIEAIDGVDEDGVASILRKSKIFLSFSELEGLSLPPIEAALSGCHVIGYTGEAAKEYWDPALFTEIHSGDLRSFVNKTIAKVHDLERNAPPVQFEAIHKLANKYSPQNESMDFQLVSRRILEILTPTRS